MNRKGIVKRKRDQSARDQGGDTGGRTCKPTHPAQTDKVSHLFALEHYVISTNSWRNVEDVFS